MPSTIRCFASGFPKRCRSERCGRAPDVDRRLDPPLGAHDGRRTPAGNFLYSLNRLNVATSRARALSILVCSPALFEPECRTPEQMRMANAFCRYLEMAARV
jgi:hypothetical protein